tara:strand:- start:1905 stop:3083 length:1179 start_codon:yes stop_codon:yes gene_type:complete
MEKIMDGLDSFLQSVAYKFPKGYPDINNEEDKKRLFEMVSSLVEEKSKITKSDLINIINSVDISDNMIARLASIIGDLESTEPIEIYLEKKAKESNISDEQIEKFLKLLRQLDIQKEFAKYIKSPVPLDLNKSNFTSLIPGIPKDKLLTLYRNMVTTIEGNVSIGPGEILFSIIFNNVKKRESKGDLDVGGKNVEVKGSLGALKNAGKEKSGEAGAIIAKGYGRGSWSSTRTTGKFEEFVKSLNMEEENELDSLKLLTKSLKWPLKVASIYDIFTKDENFDKQKFIDGFEQVLRRIYHKSSFIPKGDYFDLSSYFDEQDFNSKQFEIGLSKELISQYKEYEGFDGMLYLNRAGDMKYIPSDDDEFLNQIGKSVVIKSFSDDVPRLLYVPSSN